MSAAPIRVLELRSVRGTGGGPEKTILLGASIADPTMFEITVCYVRDARDSEFRIHEYARSLGVRYDEILERHSLDPSAWKNVRELVRTQKIDIVHAHEYKTDLLAWWLSRTEGTIPLATVHGWTGHSTRERRLYYPIDKRLLSRFPRLVAVSTEIRNELVRAGAPSDRVTTILNGIDPGAYRRTTSVECGTRSLLGVAADEFVIGAVGRLETQKRFDVLLDAFAQVRDRFKDRKLKLLIVGEGGQRAALTAKIERLGLRALCRLLGHRTDIAAVHHAFDLFVQSSDYEGTPNATLEAMALETAIVATDVGGTGELLRTGVDGLLVPAGDVGALSSAIAQVLSEPEETARRTASARQRVETELSFSSRTRKVERIYQELARRSRHSISERADQRA